MVDILSYACVPIIILIIVSASLREKNNVFDDFLEGANKGLKTVVKITPTLIGLFVAVNMLRVSGIIGLITKLLYPILKILKIPSEILPVAILTPISGSSTIAIATDLMKQYGVDSKIGLIISTIMGSTETTIYTISVYTLGKSYKNTWKVLLVGLLGDFLEIIIAVNLWGNLS